MPRPAPLGTRHSNNLLSRRRARLGYYRAALAVIDAVVDVFDRLKADA